MNRKAQADINNGDASCTAIIYVKLAGVSAPLPSRVMEPCARLQTVPVSLAAVTMAVPVSFSAVRSLDSQVYVVLLYLNVS